jgi:hypothetical protein
MCVTLAVAISVGLDQGLVELDQGLVEPNLVLAGLD